LRREIVDLTWLLPRAVEAVRPFVEERRHELTLSLGLGPLRLKGDPTRLEQIVTNLLTNAAKYTDPGGRLELAAARDGVHVVICVRDNGVGIAAEMLPRVFEWFVQGERRLSGAQGGLGIGLALVRQLVELHGGTVEARSGGLGKGSEFVVRLPSEAAWSGPEQERTVRSMAKPSTRHKVLVVDDNADAAESLAMVLGLAGQDVRTVYDGPGALAQARAFRPDIIILDIGMPGMDGREVALRLRQMPELAAVRLIAMTGWGQDEDRRASEEAGFERHLVKPVDPAVLMQLLEDGSG
jgi:CheY-like chemotaxis protein